MAARIEMCWRNAGGLYRVLGLRVRGNARGPANGAHRSLGTTDKEDNI
jgi:hypothetical protein